MKQWSDTASGIAVGFSIERGSRKGASLFFIDTFFIIFIFTKSKILVAVVLLSAYFLFYYTVLMF
jgi:hypothetical protein